MSRTQKDDRPPAKAGGAGDTASGPGNGRPQTSLGRFPVASLLVFAVLAVGIIAAGYLYYKSFTYQLRVHAERQLSSIAELKANDISRWRKERIGDAEVLYQNPALTELVRRYFADPGDEVAKRLLQSLLDNLKETINYDRISLTDTSGAEVIRSSGAGEPFTPHLQKTLFELAQAKKIAFLDFRYCSPEGEIYLSVVVPILDGGPGEELLGAVVLRMHPEDYLYPLIQRWPVPSETAETLLVRRQGNEVLYLNELRLKEDAALKLRFPLERTEIPAVKAVLGEVGIVEGLDYRGVPVIADVRPVPDSPWFLVAKTDKSEVFAPLRERFWVVMALVGVLLFVCAVILLHIQNRQKIRHFREQYASAQALQSVTLHQDTLLQAIPDIVMEVDTSKVYTWANSAGLEFFGDDVVGKEASFYFVGEQNTYDAVSPVFNGSDDTVYVESWQRRKDGQARLLAWHCRSLKNAAGEVSGAISSAQDITERRQAEQALANEAVRRRILVDGSRDGIVVLDLNGKVVDANRKYAEMLGYTHEEVMQLSVWDWDTSYPHDVIQGMLNDVSEAGDHFETRHTRKDGTQYDVELSTNAAIFNGQKLVFCVCRDITERKLAEEALREAYARMRSIIDSRVVGIVIASASGKVHEANDYYLDLIGYTRDEYEQGVVDWRAVTPPEWLPADEKAIKELRETGVCLPYEKEYVRRDGTRVPVLLSDAMLPGPEEHIAAFVLDLTERKQAQAALRESERAISALVSNLPGTVYRCKYDRNWTMEFVSEGITELSGYAPYDLIENRLLSYSDLVYPEDRERIWEEITRALESGLAFKLEYRVVAKDGSVKDVWEQGSAVRNPDGAVEALEGYIVDVTMRKQAEEALRDSELKFFNAFHSGPAGMTITRIADGKFIDANESFLKMLEHERDGVIGATSVQLGMWTPEERAIVIKAQQAAGGVTDYELDVRTKSGRVITVLLSSKPVTLRGEECLVTILVDITERKKAEAALQESEAQLRKAQEIAHLGNWTYDLSGRITWSDEMYRIYGVPIETFTPDSETFISLIHPDDQPAMQEWIRACVAGENPGELEFRAVHPGGAVRWVSGLGNLVCGSDGMPLLMTGTAQDITERKLAEVALRESETKFRHVFESSNAGKSVTQLDGKVNVNKALADMLGFTQEEMRGKTWQDITPPEDIEAIQAFIGPLLSGQADSARFEKRYVHKDGSFIWGDVSVSILRDNTGKPLHFITTVIDITERKKAEEALRESEDDIHLILDSATEGIYGNDLQGNCTFVNQAFLKILGYRSSDEILGKHIHTLIHHTRKDGTPYPPEECKIYQAFRERIGTHADDEVFWKADGTSIQVEYWSYPQIKDEKVVGAVATFVDITERKAAEARLKEYQLHLEDLVAERTRELEEQAKHLSDAYAQMESFSYSVSHDLRAPLRHIQGFTDLLIRNAGDTLDSESKRLLSVVISASSEMGRLIDELLTYSRTGRAEISRQEIALDKLVQDVYSVLSQMREGRKIALDVGKLPVVVGDPALINVVLVNLLGNAIKFTRYKKNATIAVSCQGYEDGYAVIKVKDNGAGFDMRYVSKLFGVFQRLHSQDEFEGSGIGLATVRQVINRHGGRIWAEGEIGKGACFYFTLESADNTKREARRLHG